jgi:hypothetical protein
MEGLWKMWILYQWKKIKLQNEVHFVENRKEIMQLVLKMQLISLLPEYIKLISSGVFLHAFTHMWL